MAPGQLAQPLFSVATGGLGVGQGIHGETRGKHLRQQDQVAGPVQAGDGFLDLPAVVRRLLPGQLPLHQGNTQILHSTSAADSSTASFLAKQKRSSCREGGCS